MKMIPNHNLDLFVAYPTKYDKSGDVMGVMYVPIVGWSVTAGEEGEYDRIRYATPVMADVKNPETAFPIYDRRTGDFLVPFYAQGSGEKELFDFLAERKVRVDLQKKEKKK